MADYQVMPSLSEEDYAALKADIAARGVMVPIELDEMGSVLDGHHRLKVCQELGITDYPKVIRAGMTESEKRTHARQLNMARRHLTREQRQELIREQLRETPEKSDNSIARGLGVSDKTVAVQRRKMEAGSEIPNLNVTTGTDGKQYPRQVERKPRPEPVESVPEEMPSAAGLGVSDKTVGSQRKKMEATAEIPHSDTIQGADGREYRRDAVSRPGMVFGQKPEGRVVTVTVHEQPEPEPVPVEVVIQPALENAEDLKKRAAETDDPEELDRIYVSLIEQVKDAQKTALDVFEKKRKLEPDPPKAEPLKYSSEWFNQETERRRKEADEKGVTDIWVARQDEIKRESKAWNRSHDLIVKGLHGAFSALLKIKTEPDVQKCIVENEDIDFEDCLEYIDKIMRILPEVKGILLASRQKRKKVVKKSDNVTRL